jgi:hypothetical protein
MNKNKNVCSNCGTKIDSLNFTAVMTEQWTWNGEEWELVARHSLANDPEQHVRCVECDAIIGTGKDFGF